MTSLHSTPTDPSLPGPPADHARTAPLPAARCSMVTAADPGPAGPPLPGAAGGARDDSVPRPRCGADGDDADGGGADRGGADRGGGDAAAADTAGDRTTARLRAALAERLRIAYDQGRSINELAAACRRPASEVHALLNESAPTGRASGWAEHGGSAYAQPAGPVDGEPSVPVLRAVREKLRSTATRRPSPSRRLRRMHPQAAATGQEAAERETAVQNGGAAQAGAVQDRTVRGAGMRDAGAPSVPERVGYTRTVTARQPSEDPEAAPAETPLGILIGGSPHQAEAVGRPEERAPIRVAAEPVRIGRGTSLVVLPSWRPAIAVSVPTELLLSATGLSFEQLAGAQLTVLINPGALHDRELDLRGWQAGRGRRGGRP
ncbi:helix-turn-helix domain-containing protein [Kitasatospora aureofaciens]|uniref:helix-turn-helix domain-containing protein n=1 Tax=Kitasatospora aureofaciens TaxID=1894 RepID=UPI0038045E6B